MSIKWLGGRKAARFAALALQDWLRVKLDEWAELDDLPDGWDWNDTVLIEIAMRELERIGDHVTEAERLRAALQMIVDRLDPNEHTMIIAEAEAALQE